MNTQMTPDLVDMNYAGADYPTANLGGINDGELKASAELDDILANKLGVNLSKKSVLKRYARSEAETPQDMLTPPQPALSPFGAPPGGPGLPGVKPPSPPGLPAPGGPPAAPKPPPAPQSAPTNPPQPPAKKLSFSERVSALTEEYGEGDARAVILATAALLKPPTKE
jgi:hypothetical protein